MKFHRLVFSLIITHLVILLSSCVSLKKTQNEEAVIADDGRFFKTELSGGIPVVIKQSRKDKNTCSFSLILENEPEDFLEENSGNSAGINHLLFKTLFQADGSREISFYDYNCSDYSAFCFTAEKRNFTQALNSFVPAFLTSELTESAFLQAVTNEKAAFENPSYLSQAFLDSVRSNIFENTPYSVSPFLTKDSIQNISFKTACGKLQTLRSSGKLKIAVCGDFNEDSAGSLIIQLEKNFGRIKYTEAAPFEFPELTLFENDNFLNKYNFIAEHNLLDSFLNDDFNNFLILGCFAAPSYDSEDYIPFALATVVLDSIIKNYPDFTEENALSTGCAVLPGKLQLGCFSSAGNGNAEMVLAALKSVCTAFPDAASLRRTLNPYKKLYINRQISSLEKSREELKALTVSWIYLKNPESYTGRPAQVNSVTAEQIYSAYIKYWKNAVIEWFILN